MNKDRIDQIRGILNNYIMLAIGDGIKISASDDSKYCPLGCLPSMRKVYRYRPALFISGEASELKMTKDEHRSFIYGFDNTPFTGSGAKIEDFYNLGAEYRKLFP